jgi:ribonuclease HII
LPKIKDSKQLSEKIRFELRPLIETQAISFAVAHIAPDVIDQMNILNASIEAMHQSLNGLKINPTHIIVDGNKFKPFKNISYDCIIKGDGKYLSIAAASILAKTYRDDYMSQLHETYPMYGWINNKGYPTKEHREAIVKYGASQHHRKSFRLTEDQLEIDFNNQ